MQSSSESSERSAADAPSMIAGIPKQEVLAGLEVAYLYLQKTGGIIYAYLSEWTAFCVLFMGAFLKDIFERAAEKYAQEFGQKKTRASSRDESCSHVPPKAHISTYKTLAVHEGVRCDKCLVTPLLGTRYKCAVRRNYDLCQACAGEDESGYPCLMIKTPPARPVETGSRDATRSGEGEGAQDTVSELDRTCLDALSDLKSLSEESLIPDALKRSCAKSIIKAWEAAKIKQLHATSSIVLIEGSANSVDSTRNHLVTLVKDGHISSDRAAHIARSVHQAGSEIEQPITKIDTTGDAPKLSTSYAGGRPPLPNVHVNVNNKEEPGDAFEGVMVSPVTPQGRINTGAEVNEDRSNSILSTSMMLLGSSLTKSDVSDK